MRYHSLKEFKANEKLSWSILPENNVVDIFMKPFPKTNFKALRGFFNV